MPQVTLMGHPLHPQLIVMPAGLLPFSLILDALHAGTRDQSYADAAYYTMNGWICRRHRRRSGRNGRLRHDTFEQQGQAHRPLAWRDERRTLGVDRSKFVDAKKTAFSRDASHDAFADHDRRFDRVCVVRGPSRLSPWHEGPRNGSRRFSGGCKIAGGSPDGRGARLNG